LALRPLAAAMRSAKSRILAIRVNWSGPVRAPTACKIVSTKPSRPTSARGCSFCTRAPRARAKSGDKVAGAVKGGFGMAGKKF